MLESIFADAGTTLTMGNLVICTVVSAGLGACLAAVHRYRNTGSRSFLMTLIILPVIVQMVIMVVNGNLGAGVAVMGAFSLVRFRSMPGSAREITSVFAAMAVGLADGMGYIGTAVFLTAAAVAITLLFQIVPAGGEEPQRKELKVVIPENLDYSGIFDDIFDRYTRSCRLMQVKTVNMGSLYQLEYEIMLRKREDEKKMLDEIRCRNGNLTISCGRKPERSELL